MSTTNLQRPSIFEQVFSRSSNFFKTVSEVDGFVQERKGSLKHDVGLFSENNLVVPQGNVFPISTEDINSKVDSAIEEQMRCLKRLR